MANSRKQFSKLSLPSRGGVDKIVPTGNAGKK
nr:MAG TPA: hypothetical protein [Caudoviricetes sp.]